MKERLNTISHFSQTGVKYAENKGIGLIRILTDDEIEHIAYRKERFGGRKIYENITGIICNEATPSKPIYILDQYNFNSLESYLVHLKIIDKVEKLQTELKVPFLSSKEIQKKTEELLSVEVLKIIQPTPFFYPSLRIVIVVSFLYFYLLLEK